jgi:predicted RecA/RadA family phage recombinase
MKNHVAERNTVTLIAPTGGVVKGQGYLIGGRFVVALATVAQTLEFSGLTRGVVDFESSEDWTAGARCFYDLTEHTVTPDTAEGLLPIGTYGQAGSEGDQAEVFVDGIFAVVVPGA